MDISKLVLFFVLVCKARSLIVVNITEGDNLVLKCPGHPVLLWGDKKNVYATDLKINEQLNISFRLAVTTEHHLIIKNFSLGDPLIYICESDEPQRYTLEVKLLRPPHDMHIQEADENNRVNGKEAEIITMTCHVQSGYPEESMFWHKGGDILLSGGPAVLKFTFRPTRLDHQQIFTCTANNSVSEKPTTCSVKLSLALLPNVHVIADPSANIVEGRDMLLICNYETNINPSQLNWFFNGVIVKGASYYKLSIENVTRHTSGNYTCTVKNHVGIGTDSIIVTVRYKPFIVESNTGYTYNAEIQKPTYIYFTVRSYKKPDVSWTTNTGGKLGFWHVRKEKEMTYNLSSTILPSQKDHIGRYSFRVRNSAGSIDIHIDLIDNEVNAFSESDVCNISSEVTLRCNITIGANTSIISSIWVHWYKGNKIRTLPATITGLTSLLTISHCDYRDNGVYICEWVTGKDIHSVSSRLIVYSSPIYSSQRVVLQNGLLTVALLFYSFPEPDEVLWFYQDQPFDGLNLSQRYLTDSRVQINFYNKMLETDGFIAYIVVSNKHVFDIGVFSCQVRNSFGTLDASFKGYPITHDNEFSHEFNWSFIIYGAVSIVVLLVAVAIAAVIIKQHKVFSVNAVENIQVEQREEPDRESVLSSNNELYEEIDNVSYQSVTWRNYTFNQNESEDEVNIDEINVNESFVREYQQCEEDQRGSHKYEIYNEQMNTTDSLDIYSN